MGNEPPQWQQLSLLVMEAIGGVALTVYSLVALFYAVKWLKKIMEKRSKSRKIAVDDPLYNPSYDLIVEQFRNELDAFPGESSGGQTAQTNKPFDQDGA